MDRHTRMARTLGCLVASMTIGATVLDWGQPVRSATYASNTELTAHKIREAINRSIEGHTSHRRWHAIQISSKQLAAGEESNLCHFVVYRDGNCSVTGNWLTQKFLGAEGIVRIGLPVSEYSNEIAAPQRLAADQLIHVLRRECGIPAQQVVWPDIPVVETGLPSS